MYRVVVHLLVALITFGGGLIASPLSEKTGCIAALQAMRLAEEERAEVVAEEQNEERLPVNQHSNYPEILIVLKDLVARFGKGKLHIFYVSPVQRNSDGEHVYVYWKQDNSIITLVLPIEEPLENESALWIYTGKTRIDLLKGVVASEDLVGSSTFLVTKAWVDGIIKDCITNGQKITTPKPMVKRKTRSNRS